MQLSTTLTSTSYLHCTGQHPTSFTNSGRQTVARLVPGRQQPTAETIPKSRKKDRQNKPEPRGVIGKWFLVLLVELLVADPLVELHVFVQLLVADPE
jgi:hypothetical protein